LETVILAVDRRSCC